MNCISYVLTCVPITPRDLRSSSHDWQGLHGVIRGLLHGVSAPQ